MSQWQLQEAKQHLSELISSAEAGVPQFITKRGKQVAVVIDMAEYRRTRHGDAEFKRLLKDTPEFSDVLEPRVIDPDRQFDW